MLEVRFDEILVRFVADSMLEDLFEARNVIIGIEKICQGIKLGLDKFELFIEEMRTDVGFHFEKLFCEVFDEIIEDFVKLDVFFCDGTNSKIFKVWTVRSFFDKRENVGKRRILLVEFG